MKLRNKKTGEIVEFDKEVIYYRKLTPNGHKDWTPYHPEDWEDYTPAEPLIKDEKVRKVVRAWAKINIFEPGYSVMYDADIFGLTSYQADIDFNFPLEELKGGKYYTIEELCGEEEQ